MLLLFISPDRTFCLEFLSFSVKLLSNRINAFCIYFSYFHFFFIDTEWYLLYITCWKSCKRYRQVVVTICIIIRSFSLTFAEIGLIKKLLIVIHKLSKRLFLKIVLFFKSFRFFSYALLKTKKTRFN